MTQGYAKITGRIVGPEGLGRMGSVQFLPNYQYQAVEEDGTRDILAHYAAARLAPDGRLVDMAGVPGAKVAAPTSLPAGVHNYTVILEIPGDMGVSRRYQARLLAGTTTDLTDIIGGNYVTTPDTPPSPPSPRDPLVREESDGILTAVDISNVVDLGGGLLAWKEGING